MNKMKKSLYILYSVIFIGVIVFIYQSHAKTDDYNHIVSQFKRIETSELEAIIENKQNAYIFLAKSSCMYCREAVKVIGPIAKENNIPILYIDMENITSDSNEYRKLKEIFEIACVEDKLYVPLLACIEDSTLTKYHVGTLDSHHSGKLSKEQKNELEEIFKECLEV